MTYLLIGLIMIAGGTVQGMCGFGAALVCMSVLPYVLDYKMALPVMYIASIAANLRIVLATYKHIEWKLLIMPVLFSSLGRIAGLFAVSGFSSATLSIILGLLIMATAVYQLTFSGKIRIKPNHRNGAIAGLLSGIFGGLSSAGGPPLVVYYMNVGLDKYQYISTIQANFLAGALFSAGLMAATGAYSPEVISYSAVAAAGIVMGGFIGLHLFHRIRKERLVKIINGVLLAMGLSLLIKSILSNL